MKVELLQRTYTNPDIYTFEATGITTKTLMALSRHQTFSMTAQSSRFTVKKMVKNVAISDLVTLTGKDKVDQAMAKHMANIQELAKDKSIKQDDLCMLLPQSYLYNVVVTVDSDALDHFVGLRNENTHAHSDIKKLATLLEEKRGLLPTTEYRNGMSDYLVASLAIRKCYGTKFSGDAAKELDLVRRIGITSKHMSVLRHILITVDKGYATKYSIDIGKKIIINLQSLLETNTAETIPDLGELNVLVDEYYKDNPDQLGLNHPTRISYYGSQCVGAKIRTSLRNVIKKLLNT